jgi:aminopeptidase N
MTAAPRARLTAAPLALCLSLALTLAGCSAAEEAVSQATDGAKSQAASAASDAAAAAVRSSICGVVERGNLSDADIAELRRLVDQARQVGLPQDVVGPAGELVDAGDSGTAQLEALQKECGTA